MTTDIQISEMLKGIHAKINNDEGARKEFNSWQKRTQGYEFTANVNPTPVDGIQLSGTSRFLLGITLSGTLPGDKFTFNVNEELIHIDDAANQFDPTQRNYSEEYFPCMRLLKGHDTIKFTYQGAGGQQVFLVFHYI